MKTDIEAPYNKPSWLGVGAVLAAIGASACCVGPLLLLSLGIGGAWMSTLTSMKSVRHFFIILAPIFIALDFRKLYLTSSRCEEGETSATAPCVALPPASMQSCAIPRGSTPATHAVLDWVRIYFNAAGISLVCTIFSTVRRIDMTIKISLLMLSLSSIWLLIPAVHAEATLEQQNHQQTATLDIQNMTCAMCTITIKKALQKVEGVQKVTVDYDSKTAVVIFDPQQTSNEALIKATTGTDYPTTLRPRAQ